MKINGAGLDDQCKPFGATSVAMIRDLGGHVSDLSLPIAPTLRRNPDSVKRLVMTACFN